VGKIILLTVQIYPREQIHGWREIVASRGVPRLAHWIAPIGYAGEDGSRPSKGCVARDLVASVFRHSGVQRVRAPHHFTSQNPKPRSAESTQSRAHGFGTYSQRNRPGEGALMFIAWQGGFRSTESISAIHSAGARGTRLGSLPFRPS
jgi:hypothetical protein